MWIDGDYYPPKPFGNKVFGISHRRIGNFRDPMVCTHIGALRFRTWNFGRCGVSEVGCWTPLGEITLAAAELPDNHLPIEVTQKSLTLRLGGRVSIQLIKPRQTTSPRR